jgi:hypothetical protein
MRKMRKLLTKIVPKLAAVAFNSAKATKPGATAMMDDANGKIDLRGAVNSVDATSGLGFRTW